MSTNLHETGQKRIGLVGPRRVRQGLGPYFARSLTRHGARVAAFACSRASSLPQGSQEMREACGHDVPGYASVSAMLASEPQLDAIIIASPPTSHEAALSAALTHEMPVLCEKPFLDPDARSVARAEELCAAFHERGIPLVIHAQWPETLPQFCELFPALDLASATSFRMELSPGSVGRLALVDSMSHPLSLLQDVDDSEDAHIEDVEVSRFDDAGTRHRVRFTWQSRRGSIRRSIECQIDLEHKPEPPRPAGYGFDGCFGKREIEDPGYRSFFRDAGQSLCDEGDEMWSKTPSDRRVAVPDPLDQRVLSFLHALEIQAEKPQDRLATFLPARRMRMLRRVLDAYPAGPSG